MISAYQWRTNVATLSWRQVSHLTMPRSRALQLVVQLLRSRIQRWLWLVGLLASVQAFAEKQYWVSVGSFKEHPNAQQTRLRANERLINLFSVESTQTSQGRLYRVVSGPFLSEGMAQQKAAQARSIGFTGAWVLTQEVPVSTNLAEEATGQTPQPASTEPVTKVSDAPLVEIEKSPEESIEPLMVATSKRKVQTIALTDETVNITPTQTLRIPQYHGDQSPVNVDGKLDEPIWRELPAYDEFQVLEPDTLERAPYATLVRFVHTDRGLYVGVAMEQPKQTLIKRLSGRDVRELNRDSINLTLDTSGEGRYGFWFGINLGDSLMDGTVLPERQFSSEWDGPWRGASTETAEGWSAEFFIPWGTVSMPVSGDVRKMGVYLSRKVAHLDQRWGWPALPETRPKFMSALQPIEMKGVAPRQQYNIYPFAAVTVDEIDDKVRYQFGADLFWRPSSNFQVNATVNPDFGSVESDDVVINLTATETFFPEKRLFFVESQQIFVASPRADTRSRGVGRSGPPTTMLDTRRIGGKPQSPELDPGVFVSDRERIRPVKLIGAAKFTGQVGSFRYGLLGAFEDDVKFNAVANGQDINLHQQGTDYGVARLLYEDNAGGAYRAVGVLSTAVLHHNRDAMATGLDWHYLTPGGKLKTDGQVFRSDLDGQETGYGGFWDFEYIFRQGLSQRLGIEYHDKHVNINDLGFQARNNYMQIRSAHTRRSSNLSWARNNQFDVRGAVQQNGDGYFTSGGIFFSNRTTFRNLTQITVRLNHSVPSYDDLNSFGNGTFRIEERTSAALSYQSNSSKPLSFMVGAGYEEENLGGDSYNYQLEVNWRPTDRFSLGVSVDYRDRDGWLLHQGDANFTTFTAEQWQPKLSLEYFFSARQRFRISVQWVGIRAEEDKFFIIPSRPGELIPTAKPPGPSDSFSISDLVFQARYRWEIAPLSDLFIVYTRTSDLARPLGNSSFGDLIDNAWNEPIGNQLVVKVRYRFGS